MTALTQFATIDAALQYCATPDAPMVIVEALIEPDESEWRRRGYVIVDGPDCQTFGIKGRRNAATYTGIIPKRITRIEIASRSEHARCGPIFVRPEEAPERRSFEDTRRHLYQIEIDKDNARINELQGIRKTAAYHGLTAEVDAIDVEIGNVTRRRDGRMERMNGKEMD